MNVVTRTDDSFRSQVIPLLILLMGSALAALAYLHGNDVATRGQMFTFAGGLITGGFALLTKSSGSTQSISAPPAVTPGVPDPVPTLPVQTGAPASSKSQSSPIISIKP
jgi:hypothetical protein